MASSFLSFRLVIPIDDSTEPTDAVWGDPDRVDGGPGVKRWNRFIFLPRDEPYLGALPDLGGMSLPVSFPRGLRRRQHG
jgi:hypothetical protein